MFKLLTKVNIQLDMETVNPKIDVQVAYKK